MTDNNTERKRNKQRIEEFWEWVLFVPNEEESESVSEEPVSVIPLSNADEIQDKIPKEQAEKGIPEKIPEQISEFSDASDNEEVSEPNNVEIADKSSISRMKKSQGLTLEWKVNLLLVMCILAYTLCFFLSYFYITPKYLSGKDDQVEERIEREDTRKDARTRRKEALREKYSSVPSARA